MGSTQTKAQHTQPKVSKEVPQSTTLSLNGFNQSKDLIARPETYSHLRRLTKMAQESQNIQPQSQKQESYHSLIGFRDEKNALTQAISKKCAEKVRNPESMMKEQTKRRGLFTQLMESKFIKANHTQIFNENEKNYGQVQMAETKKKSQLNQIYKMQEKRTVYQEQFPLSPFKENKVEKQFYIMKKKNQDNCLQKYGKHEKYQSQRQLYLPQNYVKIDKYQKEIDLIEIVLRDFKSFRLPNDIRLNERYPSIVHYQNDLRILLIDQIFCQIHNKIKEIKQKGLNKYRIPVLLCKQSQKKGRNNQKIKQITIISMDEQRRGRQPKKQLNNTLQMGVGLVYTEQQSEKDKGQLKAYTLCYIYMHNGNLAIKGIRNDSLLHRKDLYYVNVQGITTYERQYQAINQIQKWKFRDLLIGGKIDANNNVAYKRKMHLNTNIFQEIRTKRNPSQLQAIKEIFLSQSGIFLIQGPPGTGKTETITNLVSMEYSYLNKDGNTNVKKKILLCAQSNEAIDNISAKLHKNGLIGWVDNDKKPRLLRLGKIQQRNKDLVEITFEYLAQVQLFKKIGKYTDQQLTTIQLRILKQDLKEELQKQQGTKNRGIKEVRKKLKEQLRDVTHKLEEREQIKTANSKLYTKIEEQIFLSADIIMCTLSASGRKKEIKAFSNQIACLIIDQAGQSTQPSVLIPFQLNPDKIILVGDHKQLNPTVFGQNDAKTKYNRSLFERLIDNNLKRHTLDTQYRMIPETSEFFIDTFYQGGLKNGPISKKKPEICKIMKNTSIFYDIPYGGQVKTNNSYQNKAQSHAVIHLIKKMISLDQNITIGVISPYAAQIQRLTSQLNQDIPQEKTKNIKINTVDAFQGQQRDFIIKSVVRSNKHGNLGFVDNDKRMNVALSRCKFGIFVFGNRQTCLKNRNNDLWRSFVEHHEAKNTMIRISREKDVEREIQGNFK